MPVPTKLSLFKRNNGVYYLGYWESGRKRWKSTGLRRKTDALVAIRNGGELFKAKDKPIFLSSFIADYLAFAEANYVSGSVDICTAALKNFLDATGDVPLHSITRRHVDHYKVHRLKVVNPATLKVVKPVTLNIELRTLRSAFSMAERWGLIEKNPFVGMELLKVAEEQPPFLSKADLARVLLLVQEHWLKELIVVAVATGMRQGEMLNLCWKDVDLDRKVIHVQSTPTFRTKQGKRRTIPMSETVFLVLRAKAQQPCSELVFTRRGFKIGESYLSHRFKKYIRLAGLDERLHWHSLRHTFASWLVQDGVSLYAVQKLLGHSSVTVTEMYSHLQPEQLHDTVNRIVVSLNPEYFGVN